ncbi:MAG: sensor histidine kinase [Parvularculaceae bacterium]
MRDSREPTDEGRTPCAAVADVAAGGTLLGMSGAHGLAADGVARLADLFAAEDATRVDAALEAALDSGAPRCVSVRAPRADGGVAALDVVLPPRAYGGATAVLIDRTADAEMRARLADLSHEMKTPLNAVIGFADAIGLEAFGPVGHTRYGEYAGHIGAAGRHLLTLLETQFEAARAVDAPRSLAPVWRDPRVVARESAEMARIAAEKAGLDLTFDATRAPDACRFDPLAVRQVLLNLLANAVKFTSDGEVRLEVMRSGDDVVFAVSDTGVGMAPDELAQLGPRYTAAQGDGVRGAGGTGLGLSLAFDLARRSGGELTIDAAPGEGARARLRLPIAGPAEGEASETDDAAPADLPTPQRDEGLTTADKKTPDKMTALDKIKARFALTTASAA